MNWKVTHPESYLIFKIAERYCTGWTTYNVSDICMVVTAVHKGEYPLKLLDLLHARDPDFFHDLHGIIHHLDLDTLKLTNCFVPRMAQPTKKGNPLYA